MLQCINGSCNLNCGLTRQTLLHYNITLKESVLSQVDCILVRFGAAAATVAISFRHILRADPYQTNQPHSDIHRHWICHTVTINIHHHHHQRDHRGGRGEEQQAFGWMGNVMIMLWGSCSRSDQSKQPQPPKHACYGASGQWKRYWLRMCWCVEESCHSECIFTSVQRSCSLHSNTTRLDLLRVMFWHGQSPVSCADTDLDVTSCRYPNPI